MRIDNWAKKTKTDGKNSSPVSTTSSESNSTVLSPEASAIMKSKPFTHLLTKILLTSSLENICIRSWEYLRKIVFRSFIEWRRIMYLRRRRSWLTGWWTSCSTRWRRWGTIGKSTTGRKQTNDICYFSQSDILVSYFDGCFRNSSML